MHGNAIFHAPSLFCIKVNKSKAYEFLLLPHSSSSWQKRGHLSGNKSQSFHRQPEISETIETFDSVQHLPGQGENAHPPRNPRFDSVWRT